MDSKITITILGSGTPNIFTDREGPAISISVNDKVYVFDAGRGIIRRALQANIPFDKLSNLFLTHLHSDHTVGIPDFIFTAGVIGRTGPFHVYGPLGTQNMIDHIMAAYKDDLRIRIGGLEQANNAIYEYQIEEIAHDWIFQDGNVSITAFSVHHGDWDCFGYKILVGEKSIIISGDTCPCQNLIDQATGCDILIHEVYSYKGFQEKNPKWQSYHSIMHTSSKELGELASIVHPKTLVLYHQLYWTGSDEDIILDIKEKYKGKIISAKDLESITLK
ncbi:Ribonuclease Z [Candidatus Lokiarchaeum ossiferum]|uniref:Ribonuclease Z n=1 Tax=Candidatus Lokiarchaeum ossiferum TaxID=2951803 RepID=A0ABY6HVG2_9ARCH|nr:Ribonuclease Z [Candidatus Lokiarchaeum sp. B-35]